MGMRGINPRGRALEEGLRGGATPQPQPTAEGGGASSAAGFGGDDVPMMGGEPTPQASADQPDVAAHSPVPTGCVSNVFNPGWETDCANLETTRHCPAPPSFHSDLELCAPSCWWPAVVPDTSSLYPDWLDKCDNIWSDWQQLCNVPDHGG